jgi:hypothetical protein
MSAAPLKSLEMTNWNFGDSHRASLSLDEFLTQQEAAGIQFFNGKEPWLEGIKKLSWQKFFRVCTSHC